MCVECFRTEHDFVSGLCWLNIRENRKKDLQLEKLQKKYILSSHQKDKHCSIAQEALRWDLFPGEKENGRIGEECEA